MPIASWFEEKMSKRSGRLALLLSTLTILVFNVYYVKYHDLFNSIYRQLNIADISPWFVVEWFLFLNNLGIEVFPIECRDSFIGFNCRVSVAMGYLLFTIMPGLILAGISLAVFWVMQERDR